MAVAWVLGNKVTHTLGSPKTLSTAGSNTKLCLSTRLVVSRSIRCPRTTRGAVPIVPHLMRHPRKGRLADEAIALYWFLRLLKLCLVVVPIARWLWCTERTAGAYLGAMVPSCSHVISYARTSSPKQG